MSPRSLLLLYGALLCTSRVSAQATGPNGYSLVDTTYGVVGNSTIAGNGTNSATDGKYTISAAGIRMAFIPYGASVSNLFINDTFGVERDIVLGFDNATAYTQDTMHPYLGPVPGRYANRIANSTFTVDGMSYKILPNEHNGSDTLHGGPNGWSWRNWTVVAHTTDSISFSLADPNGSQGFPGEVISVVTYTVTPMQWHIRMSAFSLTKTSPIMLTSHTYWNLDGFGNPATSLVLNHTLSLPYSGMRVDVDGTLIPTGAFIPNKRYSVNDFWSKPKQIGANFTSPQLLGNCGTNCTGYDTCYLVNRDAIGPYDWRSEGPVAVLSSNYTGISVSVYSDQAAFQVYSCGGQNGSLPLKSTQGFFGNSSRPRVVPQYGCVVMEVEEIIDGINNPEWGRDQKQFFGPGGDPYTLQAMYEFSVNGHSGGVGCNNSLGIC